MVSAIQIVVVVFFLVLVLVLEYSGHRMAAAHVRLLRFVSSGGYVEGVLYVANFGILSEAFTVGL